LSLVSRNYYSMNVLFSYRLLVSEGWTLLNGELPGSPWDPLAGPYPTNKGGYVRIHTNFPQYELLSRPRTQC
jgi:hypothetical protein